MIFDGVARHSGGTAGIALRDHNEMARVRRVYQCVVLARNSLLLQRDPIDKQCVA